MTTEIRYIDSLDLPEIARAALRLGLNRRLATETVDRLYEAGDRLPVTFEMLHEQPTPSLRVMIFDGTQKHYLDVPFALRHLIRTATRAVPTDDDARLDEERDDHQLDVDRDLEADERDG